MILDLTEVEIVDKRITIPIYAMTRRWVQNAPSNVHQAILSHTARPEMIMTRERRTVRERHKSGRNSDTKTTTKRSFKIHFDSIGGPYIDLNKELSGEAGKEIFEKLRKAS